MANTLRFKRGLVSGIPNGALGEPLFTTDTFDLYIGNGTGNTRFQKYIASGATTQILRGDGSLYTFPLNISSPTNGQVLKYDGTNWVNSADAGVTGSGAAGQVTYWGSSSTITGSNNFFWDNTNVRFGLGTNNPSYLFHAVTSASTIGAFRNSGAALGQLLVGNTAGDLQLRILATGDGFIFSDTGKYLALGSNGVERARIFSGGNVSIGSTSDNGLRFQVTGDGYFSGSIGLGSAVSLSGSNIYIQKNITGNALSYGVIQQSTVQSDVTSGARVFYSQVGTQAAAFTLGELTHYYAVQGTFGAGSAVTNQFGYRVQTNLTGATNNYGFYGDIAAGTGRWNLYMNGTANNYMAGSLGIGTTTLTAISLRVSKNLTGAVSSIGIVQEGQIQTDVTTAATGFRNLLNTAASTTLGDYYHIRLGQGTIGASTTLSQQIGLYINDFANGTNRYGILSELSAGTGKWNLYLNGTANNYMAGSLGIGTTNLTGVSLRVNKALTGSATVVGIYHTGQVQSDVTSTAYANYNVLSTAAASFTLPNYFHYGAEQGTIGAGSAVTNQYGFYAFATLTGATNNYGFYGNIASGTGRWNLYMNGTALNYMNGALLLGSTTDSGEKLQVTGTMRVSGASTFSSSVTAASLVVDTTTLVVDATNDRVGIGTATPLGKLSIDPLNGQTRKIVLYDGGINNNFQFYGLGIEANTMVYSVDSSTTAKHLFVGGTGTTTRATMMELSSTGLSVTGTGTFSSSVTANSFAVNTSGQSRTITTFYGSGSDGSNIFIGGGGLSSTTGGGAATNGSYNTTLGVNALLSNTTGYSNTVMGASSMVYNTTGLNNSAFGRSSLGDNTTGDDNTAVGLAALLVNTTGDGNTAIGFQAGWGTGTNSNTTGSNNIFIGNISVGESATESNRTWIGNSSTASTWVGGNLLVGTRTNGTHKADINGTLRATQFNLSALNTAPATSSSTGTLGEIRIDADYIYICTATNTWKRVAISTF